jgi:hypothetical protein
MTINTSPRIEVARTTEAECQGDEAESLGAWAPGSVKRNYLISRDNITFSEGPSGYLMSLIRHPLGVFVSL